MDIDFQFYKKTVSLTGPRKLAIHQFLTTFVQQERDIGRRDELIALRLKDAEFKNNLCDFLRSTDGDVTLEVVDRWIKTHKWITEINGRPKDFARLILHMTRKNPPPVADANQQIQITSKPNLLFKHANVLLPAGRYSLPIRPVDPTISRCLQESTVNGVISPKKRMLQQHLNQRELLSAASESDEQFLVVSGSNGIPSTFSTEGGQQYFQVSRSNAVPHTFSTEGGQQYVQASGSNAVPHTFSTEGGQQYVQVSGSNTVPHTFSTEGCQQYVQVCGSNGAPPTFPTGGDYHLQNGIGVADLEPSGTTTGLSNQVQRLPQQGEVHHMQYNQYPQDYASMTSSTLNIGVHQAGNLTNRNQNGWQSNAAGHNQFQSVGNQGLISPNNHVGSNPPRTSNHPQGNNPDNGSSSVGSEQIENGGLNTLNIDKTFVERKMDFVKKLGFRNESSEPEDLFSCQERIEIQLDGMAKIIESVKPDNMRSNYFGDALHYIERCRRLVKGVGQQNMFPVNHIDAVNNVNLKKAFPDAIRIKSERNNSDQEEEESDQSQETVIENLDLTSEVDFTEILIS